MSYNWLKIDQSFSTDSTAITSSASTTSNTNLTITPPASGPDFNLYTWSDKNSYARNSIISVTIPGDYNPQIQMRWKDQNNIGSICFLNKSNNTLTISEFVSGVQNQLNVGPGSFPTTGTYKLYAKSFENLICTLLIDPVNSKVLSDCAKCVFTNNSFINNDSQSNGLSCSFGTVTFNDYYCTATDSFTNFLCIGDSNTAGNSGPNPPVYLGENWVQQLNYDFKDQPVYFNNCGTAGYTSYETLSALPGVYLPRAVKYANNVAIILIGTNDVAGNNGHTYNQATTLSNIQNIVDTLNQNGIIAWVLTYFPRSDNTAFNNTLNKLNVAIKKTIKCDKIIDTWESFKNPVSGEPPQTNLLQSDGLHLSSYSTYNNPINGTFKLKDTIKQVILNTGILNLKGYNYSGRGVNLFNGLTFSDKETLSGSGTITTTLNKNVTIINWTLPNSPAVASGKNTSFVFNNTKIKSWSQVTVGIVGYSSASGLPGVYVKSVGTGSVTIVVNNASNVGNLSLSGTIGISVTIN